MIFTVLAMLLTIVLFSHMQAGSFMDLYNDKNAYVWLTNDKSVKHFWSYSSHNPEYIQFGGPFSEGNMLSTDRLNEIGMIGVYIRKDIKYAIEQRVDRIFEEMGMTRLGRLGYGKVEGA